MKDIIQWLEAIGRDARLRHAPGPELAAALAGMGASRELQDAVACANGASFRQALGGRINLSTQVNQNPHDGGCDPSGGGRRETREEDRANPEAGPES